MWQISLHNIPLILRPCSGCSLGKFAVKLAVEETRLMELSYSVDRIIVAWVFLTQYRRVSGRRTDRSLAIWFTTVNTAIHNKLFWHAVKIPQRACYIVASCWLLPSVQCAHYSSSVVWDGGMWMLTEVACSEVHGCRQVLSSFVSCCVCRAKHCRRRCRAHTVLVYHAV